MLYCTLQTALTCMPLQSWSAPALHMPQASLRAVPLFILSLSLYRVFISRGLFPMHYNYVSFLYNYYYTSCMAPGVAWFCSVLLLVLPLLPPARAGERGWRRRTRRRRQKSELWSAHTGWTGGRRWIHPQRQLQDCGAVAGICPSCCFVLHWARGTSIPNGARLY